MLVLVAVLCLGAAAVWAAAVRSWPLALLALAGALLVLAVLGPIRVG